MSRLLLVSMPWATVAAPSIQLGLLKAVGRRAGHTVDDLYGNLALLRHIDPATYRHLSEGGVPILAGEWLFAAELLGDGDPDPDSAARIGPADAYPAFLRDQGRIGADDEALLRDLRSRVVPACLDALEAMVDWGRYDAVGFSCVFAQAVPSLALARRIRRRHPDVRIVLGGAQCDGPMGPGLLDAFPWIDAVFTGAAERSLPAWLEALDHHRADGGDIAPVAGVRSRATPGRGAATPAPERVPLDDLPVPDYDTYFERTAGIPLSPWIALEASRGCWWGQKSQCTFCGIAPATMPFAAKSPDRVLEEMETLSRRHRVLDFVFTDYIMDHRFHDRFVPELAARNRDWTLFFEIKSNIGRAGVRALAAAGITRVQPGIESLSTRVLKLMRKGCTAMHNIRLLRWCAEEGIDVTYNILWGFPGETAADCDAQTDLTARLRHLQPPGVGTPIVVHRFSPLFDGLAPEPARGIRPRRDYDFVFDASRVDIAAVAYEHEADAPADPALAAAQERLGAAVDAWRAGHAGGRARLHYRRGPGYVAVEDSRGPHTAVHELEGIAAALFLACLDEPPTLPALRTTLATDGLAATDAEIEGVLAEMEALGLVFREDGRTLTLALPHPSVRHPATPPRAAPSTNRGAHP